LHVDLRVVALRAVDIDTTEADDAMLMASALPRTLRTLLLAADNGADATDAVVVKRRKSIGASRAAPSRRALAARSPHRPAASRRADPSTPAADRPGRGMNTTGLGALTRASALAPCVAPR
jgi:hypothetical protein